MPAFNGPLNHSNPLEKLLELAAHQVRGIGIFDDVAEREDLPEALRSSPYIAYMCNDDKIYVYDGPRQSVVNLADKLQFVDDTDWEDSANWTELGGTGNEANDLSSSVTWVNVPSGNITEGSVTQHEAALTIGQGQVTGLGGALTTLQNATTANGSAITTLQGADTTLQNNINAVNTTISGLDTDDITEGNNLYYTTGRFNTAFSAKSTDDLSEGSTNLYNVQADWNASGTDAQILNKPSLFDGNYNSLSNKPALFDGDYTSLANIPSTFVPSAHSHAINEITNLQTSLNGKADVAQVTNIIQGADLDMGSNDITTTGKILFSNYYPTVNDLPTASTYHGMFAHVHATGAAYFAHGGNWIELANNSDVTGNDTDIAGLQTELDATQAGAGLNADGTYTANASAYYTSAAGSLTAADDALDAAINVNATAISNINNSSTGQISSSITITNNDPAFSHMTSPIASGTSIEDIISDILEKYNLTTITLTSVVASYENPDGSFPQSSNKTLGLLQSNILEVGQTLRTTGFNFSVGTPSQTVDDSVVFKVDSTTLVSGVADTASSGSYTADDQVKNSVSTQGEVEFEVEVVDSEGGSSVTRSKTRNAYWRNRVILGASSTSAIANNNDADTLYDGITQMGTELNSGGSWSVNTTADGNSNSNYTYIIFPAVFGDLQNVIQGGALSVIDAFTDLGDFTITNQYGASISYSFYRTNNTASFANGTSLAITF